MVHSAIKASIQAVGEAMDLLGVGGVAVFVGVADEDFFDVRHLDTARVRTQGWSVAGGVGRGKGVERGPRRAHWCFERVEGNRSLTVAALFVSGTTWHPWRRVTR